MLLRVTDPRSAEPQPSPNLCASVTCVMNPTLRACLKILKGAVFAEKAEWRGATKENIPGGSSTEEQRSQPAFSAKTLRAAGLLAVACVGPTVTARCGDAPASPPWPRPKSLAAAPFRIFRQALRDRAEITSDFSAPEFWPSARRTDGASPTHGAVT